MDMVWQEAGASTRMLMEGLAINLFVPFLGVLFTTFWLSLLSSDGHVLPPGKDYLLVT
jgi:hypothetical protein